MNPQKAQTKHLFAEGSAASNEWVSLFSARPNPSHPRLVRRSASPTVRKAGHGVVFFCAQVLLMFYYTFLSGYAGRIEASKRRSVEASKKFLEVSKYDSRLAMSTFVRRSLVLLGRCLSLEVADWVDVLAARPESV